MIKIFALLICLALLAGSALAEAAGGSSPTVTGTVTEIEKYGHARLDVTVEDLEAAGFALGDIVTVTVGGFSADMPYLNGYYVERGGYELCAYPAQPYLSVCINYGRFADAAGVRVGDTVTVGLAEKAGALALQEVSSLVYSNDRADFPSDEVFANFRPVVMGSIQPGRLYRSASPINSKYSRAVIADRLIEAAGVRTVMDLADNTLELVRHIHAKNFDSGYYKSLMESGHVIGLGVAVDYTSPDFIEGIVKGLTFLSERETPFLVHCNEGKDRAGFTIMLIGALCGAEPQEILDDYMRSFINLYGVEPGTEKYELLLERNGRGLLRVIAGLPDGAPLEGADLVEAARNWLLAGGMSGEAIDALRAKLQ